MLTMLFYISFFAVTDFIIYAVLNQAGIINSKLWIGYGFIFLLVIVLHTGLFEIKFLMPFKNLFNLLLFSIIAVPFYFFGRYRIGRLKGSNRLSESLKPRACFYMSLVFQKLPILMIFIVQCMSIFAFIYM
jgi:hypothetical protein